MAQSTMAASPTNQHIPAAQQAYQALHESILRLELEPGQSVSEKEISVQIGVSRQPVREAFIRLAQEGLLNIRPQIGTFVSRLNVAQIHEAVFARVALECASVRLAAGRASARDLRDLGDNIRAHRQASDDGEFDLVYQLDAGFHIKLLEIGGHPGLWKMVNQARSHMARLRQLSVTKMSNTSSQAVAFHTRIMEAVAAGDGDLAARQLEAHIAQNVDYMDQLIAEIPAYFET
ncbi:MAG: GntR family transcriptional regulator [Rhodospirillales bacterium]|nr:GntR family transcriptional regulator [Rhodospirillales bacterium]